MQVQQLDDAIFATGQISETDLAVIAKNGIRTVVNNRPDGEAEDQPVSEELAAAAESLGLNYVHFPVLSNGITPDNVQGFAAMRDDLEGPVLLFCRTGARSAKLWQLSFTVS
jgi:sulfide:quinone oxidoreductase